LTLLSLFLHGVVFRESQFPFTRRSFFGAVMAKTKPNESGLTVVVRKRLTPEEVIAQFRTEIEQSAKAKHWNERDKLQQIVNELFPNAVDGRDKLSGDSFSVDEHDAVDQVL
jgi:hypothetical protein